MGKLTENGYIPSTPDEIQKDIVNYIKIKAPEFTLYPADLQSDLINTSVADLLQYENLTSTMLNTISPNNSNEWLFNAFATFFGLEKHSNTINSVELSISKLNPSQYIPEGMQFSTSLGVFTNQSPFIADSSGNAIVIANNQEVSTIVQQNASWVCSELQGATIKNNSQSILKEPETFYEYKTRIQNNFKANTQSSYDLLVTELSNLGVDKFSVHLNPPTAENKFTYSQTLIFLPSILNIEQELKKIIFGTMGVDSYLQSITSDKDKTREKISYIDFFGSTLPVRYVIAKLVTLDIQVSMNISILLEQWEYLKNIIINNIKDIFKKFNIGSVINVFIFKEVVFNSLKSADINVIFLEDITFIFSINGVPQKINPKNQVIECTAFDTFLQLGKLDVAKLTN